MAGSTIRNPRSQKRETLNDIQRHRPPPPPGLVSNDVDDGLIFYGINEVPKLSVGEDSVAPVRDNAEEDGEEGKEDCQGVWDEEAGRVVSIPVHGVPAGYFGGDVVSSGW
jgi:hypothetical protein